MFCSQRLATRHALLHVTVDTVMCSPGFSKKGMRKIETKRVSETRERWGSRVLRGRKSERRAIVCEGGETKSLVSESQ